MIYSDTLCYHYQTNLLAYNSNHFCVKIIYMFVSFLTVLCDSFSVTLMNVQYMRGNEYLMDEITWLPDITFLSIVVTANTHSYGACLFYILGMCTGVRKLALDTPDHFNVSLSVTKITSNLLNSYLSGVT